MKSAIIFAIVAACVAFAVAQPADTCCSPNQWEGETYGMSQLRNVSFFEFISYDYVNKRFRADVYSSPFGTNKRYEFSVIEKFNAAGVNTLYIINDATGSCTSRKSQFPVMRQACVPGGFVHSWSFTIGAALEANSYIFQGQGSNGGVFDMTVAAQTCVPIRGLMFNHHSTIHGPEVFVNYVNVKAGISNPNIFNTPANC